MKTLSDLLGSGTVWRAEGDYAAIKKENISSRISSSSLESLSPLLQDGGLHEWFYDSQNPLCFFPPVTPIVPLLKTILSKDANTKKLITWIGGEVSLSPFFLQSTFSENSSFDFNKLIFLYPKSRKEHFWALETVLGSQSSAGVVSSISKLPFAKSQKLSLLANQSKATCFIFRDQKELGTKSAARTRWLVAPVPSSSRHPTWNISLLHSKGTMPDETSWFVEVQDEQAISLNIFSALVYQSAATDLPLKRYA